MANEDQKSKKPPAHEVIARNLKKLHDEWLIGRDACRSGKRVNITCIEKRAGELVSVLKHMYIPEDARMKVIERLRGLPKEFLKPMSKNFAEIMGDTGGA